MVDKINVIQADKQFLQQNIDEKDEYLAKLMRFVKREKKAKEALVAEIETLSEGATKTKVEYKYKEVILSQETGEDSITYLMPEYSTEWEDKWGKGFILATPDSIYRKVTFTNEFEIWETQQNVGTWFNPVISKTIHWKNLNPNTTTNQVRKWEVKGQKPKKFVLIIGPNLSINKNGKIQGGFGLSAGYKIFER